MRVISRWRTDGVRVYDAGLDVVRTFPVSPPDDDREPGAVGHAVTAAHDRLVYTTGDAVVRIDPDGREDWRLTLPERGPGAGLADVDVALSADESLVWVYLPNSMADRGHDEWLALDAVTGAVRTRHPLPTSGHGGRQFALRDGRMLLEVGEGQNGIQIYRAGPDTALHDYGWGDRSLTAVSPDGSQFLTVGHEQEDLRIHDFPDGRTRLRLTVADFGFDPGDDVFVEWNGGYLDEHTVIAVIGGIDDDAPSEDEEEWWRHYRVDVRTGQVLGELNVTTIDQYDLTPLGDGTYLVTDTDGTLRRM